MNNAVSTARVGGEASDPIVADDAGLVNAAGLARHAPLAVAAGVLDSAVEVNDLTLRILRPRVDPERAAS